MRGEWDVGVSQNEWQMWSYRRCGAKHRIKRVRLTHESDETDESWEHRRRATQVCWEASSRDNRWISITNCISQARQRDSEAVNRNQMPLSFRTDWSHHTGEQWQSRQHTREFRGDAAKMWKTWVRVGEMGSNNYVAMNISESFECLQHRNGSQIHQNIRNM